MALLPILVAPDPRLKEKAKPVGIVDDTIRRLLDDMLETMYAAPGIGLAAPQVGQSLRALVIDVSHREKGEHQAPVCMVDPEILWVSNEDAVYEEGCLSVPDHYADVVRPARIRVRFLDRDGQRREVEMGGLLAIVAQHEMDHLDGVLFIDHLSNLKRNMILRKLIKSRKSSSGTGS